MKNSDFADVRTSQDDLQNYVIEVEQKCGELEEHKDKLLSLNARFIQDLEDRDNKLADVEKELIQKQQDFDKL